MGGRRESNISISGGGATFIFLGDGGDNIHIPR